MWNKQPFQIQVLTNLDCNLRCTYCYENKTKGKNNVELINKFITSRINEFNDTENDKEDRAIVLDLVGGETLMYPKMLDEILTHAKSVLESLNLTNEIVPSISTNGTLIANNKDVQDFILKWRPYLGLSIDGTKEIHDACRIDVNGKGSYDDAIAGLRWCQANLCPKTFGVKATYCHETIEKYSEGVINLIKLGFLEISANVVFEEIWTIEKDSLVVFREMTKVADYILDNGLQDKVHIHQLNNSEMDMHFYKPRTGPKTQNFCGSCSHMRCIGFDGLVYGCNRFCTMKDPIEIGHLEGEEVIITNEKLIEEVINQFDDYPEECKKCEFGHSCFSCSAIPYEQENINIKEYLAEKRQCGFTHAVVAARLYFKNKLLGLEALEKARADFSKTQMNELEVK